MQVLDNPPAISTLRFQELTVRHIFEDNNNWDVYAFHHRDDLRDVEVSEVQKMLSCKDDNRGYSVCYCNQCKEVHIITFGCNSRICTHCGKRYTDQWANNLPRRMFDVPHRHFVMSVASQLWPLLLECRSLWKVIMDAVIKSINSVLSHYLRQTIIAGAIVVLHPFSRDIQFKPHIHVLLTEGGFNRKGEFVHKSYFPAEAMRKTWQYQVLSGLRKALPDTTENYEFITELFRTYDKGFYVYLPKETKLKSKRQIARYVARYVRHPAIANFRLCGYDGEHVDFWYDDNENTRHYVRMTVAEFIQSVIQHIPERQFKMIRYYGAYCRKWSSRFRKLVGLSSITQTNLGRFTGKKAFHCPNCGTLMEVIMYQKKGPPDSVIFGEKIDHWMSICSS